MTTQIQKIKRYHSRITTAINELEHLENEEKDVYNDILYEMRWITQILEQRREILQRKGRTQ